VVRFAVRRASQNIHAPLDPDSMRELHYSFTWVLGLAAAITLPVWAFFNIQVPFPPIVGDDRAQTAFNQPVNINLVANDSDPDGTLDFAQLTVIEPPSHGIVAVNPQTGACTYIPAAGYNGSDRFSYRICDDEGVDSNIGFVSISIAAPPSGN
jgi:hypothetical protein